MKKVLSIAFFALIGISINAQEDSKKSISQEDIKVAFNIGTTAGDDLARDVYSTNVGFDFAYLHDVTSDLKIGLTTGIVYIFNDGSQNVYKESRGAFVSFGGTFRFYTDNDKFYLGSDAGYTYGLENGGFYYRPRIGLVVSDCSGINVTYGEVNDKGTYSYVNIGYEFSF